eukprot:scaffold2153_cov131-Cylindrotheca_fusiformis.AAC.12
MDLHPVAESDAKSWWTGCPSGDLRLISRCQYVWNWSPKFCRRVLLGYKDFLELKQEANDFQGNQIIPSVAIRQMWQQHILDTHNYEKDCILLVGQKVEYPVDDDDEDNGIPEDEAGTLIKDTATKTQRIADTLARLCQKKRCEPMDLDKDVWAYPPPSESRLQETDLQAQRRRKPRRDKVPHATIAIQWKNETNDEVAEFKISQSMKLDRIFKAYAKQRGLDRNSLSFLLRSQDVSNVENNGNGNAAQSLDGNETLLQLFSGKITEENDIQVWIDCEPSRWEC